MTKKSKMQEKRYSHQQDCRHCGNSVTMEIVSEYSQVSNRDDSSYRFQWEEGPVHELLVCPACQKISLRRYYWHSMRMDPSEIDYEALYPFLKESEPPQGLPEPIQKAYNAANKVREIDANAYAVLIGRLLELVCEDRKASGKTLADRLADLARKGEIPEKLVAVANKLRILRNIGAHASLGELTPGEIPILDKLCGAILEYVYSAPYLVKEAEKSLSKLKKKATPAKKKKSPKSS